MKGKLQRSSEIDPENLQKSLHRLGLLMLRPIVVLEAANSGKYEILVTGIRGKTESLEIPRVFLETALNIQ